MAGSFTLIGFLMSSVVSALWLFPTVSWDGLQGLFVVFPGHIHLLLDQARHSFIVGILCLVLVLLCALSSFNHLDGEERSGCFTLIVIVMSCDSYSSPKI